MAQAVQLEQLSEAVSMATSAMILADTTGMKQVELHEKTG